MTVLRIVNLITSLTHIFMLSGCFSKAKIEDKLFDHSSWSYRTWEWLCTQSKAARWQIQVSMEKRWVFFSWS